MWPNFSMYHSIVKINIINGVRPDRRVRLLPVLLETGARVIAPDLFGFGRPTGPYKTLPTPFTSPRVLLRFVEHLALRNITLVVQDWEGTLGLTWPSARRSVPISTNGDHWSAACLTCEPVARAALDSFGDM